MARHPRGGSPDELARAGGPLLERVFLEFRDIEVDLAGRKAVTRAGRVVALRYCLLPRVVVLALA